MNVISVENSNKKEKNTYIKINFNDKLEVVLCEYDSETNKLLKRITYKHYASQEEEVIIKESSDFVRFFYF